MSEKHYTPSPCVRQCTLNEQDVCVGCGRSLDEIKQWTLVTADEQEAIVRRAEKRKLGLRQKRSSI